MITFSFLKYRSIYTIEASQFKLFASFMKPGEPQGGEYMSKSFKE